MAEKVVPMIHVPDVRATVDWYQGIGFTVGDTYGDDGEGLSFAFLSFGSSEVMFNSGGRPSTHHRREVDLYVYADNVDDLYQRLKDRVEVVEDLHDTFYGMREFIIRDLNRFWITFGQPSVFEVLMTGVREGNVEAVRSTLESGGLKPETLTAALRRCRQQAIPRMSRFERCSRRQAQYRRRKLTPRYCNPTWASMKAKTDLRSTSPLRMANSSRRQAAQKPLSLLAVDQTTFRPIAFDEYGSITFNVEAGKTTGCALTHGEHTMQLNRVEETKRA